jgi:SAM-dependent methyltransferase
VELSAAKGAGLAEPTPPVVVWHELECGLYRVDLALWLELAEEARLRAPGPVLDVGAGSGRVAIELAGAGHEVHALDLDPQLLAALSARAARAGVRVRTVCADARTFALERQDFALCIVPMQTLQLLGGAAGRMAFLERARAHLRPGALLACAIVTELEPFDCSAGDLGPSPEVARVDGLEYVSRATRVQVRKDSIRIERERRIRPIEDSTVVSSPPRSVVAPEPERDVIELDRVSAGGLQREGLSAGLQPVEVREIAPTREHVGSDVVILRA